MRNQLGLESNAPLRPASHAAFEVVDFDDLMADNHHLQAKSYRHDWGVGRHILGSQAFDYWRDPWGHRVEHWTDGDLFDAAVPANVTDLPTMLGHQWAPPHRPISRHSKHAGRSLQSLGRRT